MKRPRTFKEAARSVSSAQSALLAQSQAALLGADTRARADDRSARPDSPTAADRSVVGVSARGRP